MKAIIFRRSTVHLFEFQICPQVLKLGNTKSFFISRRLRFDLACQQGSVQQSRWFGCSLCQISFLRSTSRDSGKHGEIMQLFQHLVKTFLDHYKEDVEVYENIPLLFLFFDS